MKSTSFLSSVVSLAYQNQYLMDYNGAKRKLGKCERVIRALFWWIPGLSSSTTKCLRVSFLVLHTQLESHSKDVPHLMRQELLSFDISTLTPAHPLWNVKGLIDRCRYLALSQAHQAENNELIELKKRLSILEASAEKEMKALRAAASVSGTTSPDPKKEAESKAVRAAASVSGTTPPNPKKEAESKVQQGEQDYEEMQDELEQHKSQIKTIKSQFEAIAKGLQLRFRPGDQITVDLGTQILHEINAIRTAQRASQRASAIGPRDQEGIALMEQFEKLRKELASKNAELAKTQKERDEAQALAEARKPITFATGTSGGPRASGIPKFSPGGGSFRKPSSSSLPSYAPKA